MTHYKKHKLYKRKDGRWQIAFTVNKQKYFAYGKTQKECCEKFDLLLKNIKTGNIKSKKVPLLFEWLDTYVNVYKKDNKTAYETARQINYHIKPNLENTPINKIDPLKIDSFIASIKASRTRKAIYTILHDALGIAYRKRLTKENFADFISKVKHTPKEGHRLTNDEIKLIFDNIENQVIYKLLYFYLYTGVRRKEALTLRFSDFDIKNDIIHIHGTKTCDSDRFIPLFNNIKKIIDIKSCDDYVFNISESTIAREIKKIKLKCNINFAIKDFRTTFASQCHEKGIDDYTIKNWLGHTSVTTTQKHYIKHRTQKSMEDAKLTDNLFGF